MAEIAELQGKLNCEPHRVSTAKVRALIWKEWDTVSWEGTDEAGNSEPLNSDVSSLPVGKVLPPPSGIGSSPPAKCPPQSEEQGHPHS